VKIDTRYARGGLRGTFTPILVFLCCFCFQIRSLCRSDRDSQARATMWPVSTDT